MARSILVVDDHHASAEVLAKLLDGEGYRVRCAFDGQAALRAIAQAPPDLVLADMLMLTMDGVTLAKELWARGWTMPVVLLSAVATSVKLPGVTFLPKPFEVEELLGVIKLVLSDHPRARGWSLHQVARVSPARLSPSPRTR